MNPTTELREAFDEVADALESYFEGVHGMECGMSCGGFIHAYCDLLTHEDESPGRVERLEELEGRAESIMLQFFLYYLRKLGYHVGPAMPASSLVNLHPEGLPNRLPGGMVKSGELIPRFPDNPMNTEQAHQSSSNCRVCGAV